MGLIDFTASAFERADVPDAVSRMGIAFLVGRTGRALERQGPGASAAFAREMRDFPVALNPELANVQHYEVPAEFYELVLGPQRKYSSCLYPEPDTTLLEAEELALAETAANAGLSDGQSILELGCGWGSMTLWMARSYPRSTIIAVSNSGSQRDFIVREAAQRGLGNVAVVTADMNDFSPGRVFDRVVSIEMFEHMSNWPALLGRIGSWLNPGGRLFVHVFSHCTAPYRFDHADKSDWIAQHFFTGGIMPSHGLIREFGEMFEVEAEWRWSGRHYMRTARDWLRNFDRNRPAIDAIMRRVYGEDAGIWTRRWRLFFLATEGLFGHRGGQEWGVSQYRLRPAGR